MVRSSDGPGGQPQPDLHFYRDARSWHDDVWEKRVAWTDDVPNYSGPTRLRRQAAGGFAGVPDRQRQGSFGDVDRNVSVTYDHGFERSHMARDSGVAGWLRAAHLTGDVADRLLDELHHGHAVLLAEVAEPDVRDAKARLQNMANGA